MLDPHPYGLIAILALISHPRRRASTAYRDRPHHLHRAPMVQKAGFDLVWFGIFIVLLVEIAD